MDVFYDKAKDDVLLTHGDDWSLSINLDMELEELIFTANVAVNSWLAIGFVRGLSDDRNADVIQWIAGTTREGSHVVHDRINVEGVLISDPDSHVRSSIEILESPTGLGDDVHTSVQFKSERYFDTGDPLDRVIDLSDSLPI